MSSGKLYSGPILRVAVDVPMRQLFDFLPEHHREAQPFKIGTRLWVPFGQRKQVAVLIEAAVGSDVPYKKLKTVLKQLDQEPLLSPDILRLLGWASEYYHHPIGDVVINAFPTLLRANKPFKAKAEVINVWALSAEGRQVDTEALIRSPRQRVLMTLLCSHAAGLTEQQLNESGLQWRPVMKRLLQKAWVVGFTKPVSASDGNKTDPSDAVQLNQAQSNAINTVQQSFGTYNTFLLDGITGSGKTEVYLKLIEVALAQGRQALVLVPEIGLTPQLVSRFKTRFKQSIAVLHSGLTDKMRVTAWLAAKDGCVDIVIGTRSAITTPMPRLGIIIIDEEHDSSFKQQEGFRYSARDMAIVRAKNANIPIVLGSATPSLESLYNQQQNRYQLLELPERVGAAVEPTIQVIDVRSQTLHDGLSQRLLDTMRVHLEQGAQVLLFINRRGFAPTLLCHDCGWVACCQRCDSHMTYHHGRQRLRCHHCGAERRAENACPECRGSTLVPLGAGTERIEQAIKERFSDVGVVRIDRDTTQRKGALESILNDIHSGKSRILIGTQMLSKGHHFPNVTLVGILNVDQGLFSVDFRAMEKMAQLVVQVAGRAGREEKPGQVLIQSHHPEHPLLQTLIQKGYGHFARQALQERKAADLPPYSYVALLRAEAVDTQLPLLFLTDAKQLAVAHQINGVTLLGPIPAPMEKRAGRYRAQLFIQSAQRSVLHQLLTPWILQLEKLKIARKVRWSIDVDPVDIY
ncbi:MAG: primosomal protein N' [Gammaproteobacteria bacterium]|nr:primosomal protein N' [Gammaproteobacteria bacterium]